MITFELQENKYPTLVYCDICRCSMPIIHNHEYGFLTENIQYYWHCGLCGGYHSTENGCPFDRTPDEPIDQNNVCPTCGKRVIEIYPSI